MARCGCSNTCSCSVVAGTGTTVTGTGSVGDPYVINAGASGGFQVTDSPTVDHTLTGAGTAGDPYILTSAVKISPAAGNLVTTDANGLLVTCESIQDCVGAAFDDGLIYDDAANQMRVRISADAGNTTVIGTDGGVYSTGGGGGGLVSVATADTPCIDLSGNGVVGTPLSAAPIVDPAAGNLMSCTATGLRAALTLGACGLTGAGTAASPLAVNVGTWPYPCSVDTFGGVVACDATGQLRSEPRGYMFANQTTQNTAYANLAVPAPFDVLIETRTHDVVNPDTCRESFTLVELELDVDFDLVAGAGGAAGMYTDEMYYHRNTGGSTEQDFHIQVSKVIAMTPFQLAVGANNLFGFDIRMGRGSGGATYNRIQTFIRAFQWIL